MARRHQAEATGGTALTVTVAGARLTYHSVRWWSWLQHCRARIDTATPGSTAPGDDVVLMLDGVPVFVGAVTTVRRNYRHIQIDAVPRILTRMATETGPVVSDPNSRRRASDLAVMLGIGPPQFDGGTNRQLARWSTRARLLGWQWESLIRTLGATWRYSPRDDRLVVEADREAWPEQPPMTLRRAGEFLLFAAADLQAGDRVAGAEVVSVESWWERGDEGKRTKARIA